MDLNTALCCLIYTIVLILLCFCFFILAGAWDIYRGMPKKKDLDKKMREIYEEDRDILEADTKAKCVAFQKLMQNKKEY